MILPIAFLGYAVPCIPRIGSPDGFRRIGRGGDGVGRDMGSGQGMTYSASRKASRTALFRLTGS